MGDDFGSGSRATSAAAQERSPVPQEETATARATRCYTITGAANVLDKVEEMLRRIEAAGEQSAARLVTAFVCPGRGAVVAVRVLAGWLEEDDAEPQGAILPRLADEAAGHPCAVIDLTQIPLHL